MFLTESSHLFKQVADELVAEFINPESPHPDQVCFCITFKTSYQRIGCFFKKQHQSFVVKAVESSFIWKKRKVDSL